MPVRAWLSLSLVAAGLAVAALASRSTACCPAPPSGQAVVNADQTVIILWDAAAKTQHFIRQASFMSEADDFGFLVPSPSQPELDESGNDAFPYLAEITAPEVRRVARPSQGFGCGCGSAPPSVSTAADEDSVRVLEEKQVAGFAAVVLEADSATALVEWLQENGFAFSSEVETWARPYVEQGWKFTALKVAKDKSEPANSQVATAALRLSFQTDRPLFPYREPDSRKSAETLDANERLLRIYFLGEARYDGELTREQHWTGQVAWAGKLSDMNRGRILELLNLPESVGPNQWWLTEFEDDWPYEVAPADLYFTPSAQQDVVKRPPVVQYVSTDALGDFTEYALVAVVLLPLIWRQRNARARSQGHKA